MRVTTLLFTASCSILALYAAAALDWKINPHTLSTEAQGCSFPFKENIDTRTKELEWFCGFFLHYSGVVHRLFLHAG